MKELSIEQKAQAYDGLIERLKDLKFAYRFSPLSDTIEETFPELKESEDKRIKSDIQYAVRCAYGDSSEQTNKILAWLEKQGEHAKFCDSIQVGDKVTRNQDGVLVNLSQLERVAKPADKVEPKFKVGDWVVNNNGEPQLFQVISHSWPDSKIKRVTNNLEIFINSATLDKQYHLWTIQDAKDGDVLANDHHILILKELGYTWASNGKPESLYAYCGIKPNGNFELAKEHYCFCGTLHTHPATKEQRDLLFQKMKEAGYEWNAEKRELKKIEQKHFCKLDNSYARVKFPFKAKVKSSGKIVTIHDGQLSYDGKEWIKYQSDAKDGYKVYEPNNLLELVCEIEQNPAWSKEDRTNLFECIKAIKGNYSTAYGQELINWLKSLENRVLLQTNEWSEEDEKILKAIHNSVDVECLSKNGLDYIVMVDWLKSLKDRCLSHPQS